MRLLLDHHVPVAIAEQLRRRGWDVVTAYELDLEEEDDLPLWEAAIKYGRAVVTYNVADFYHIYVDFFHRGISHPGLILISSRTFNQDDIGGIVRTLDREMNARSGLDNEMIFLTL